MTPKLARHIAILLLLIQVSCGPDGAASAPPNASGESRAPSGDPAALPKVAPDVGAITAMLRERFGDAVARNIHVAVENGPQGLRVGLTGEVPNDELRVAIMREVETRVPDIKFQDFNLDLAGPVRMLFAFPIARNPEGVYFAPDLSFAITRRGTVYETATGRRMNRIDLSDASRIRCMELSPDGRSLAVGFRGGEIALFEMPLGRNRRRLQPPGPESQYDDPVALAFTRDSKQLATINSKNGDLRLWDLERGGSKLIGAHVQPNQPRRLDDRYCVAIAPNGSMIASVNQDESDLFLWSVASRSRIESPKLDRLSPTVLAWSNDGRTIAVGRTTDNTRGVLLYDIAGKQSRILSTDRDDILEGLAFSPDDKSLAVAYQNQGVRIWDLSSGKIWQSIDESKCSGTQKLSFSPDGAVLATDASQLRPPSIRLWDVSQRPGAGPAKAALPNAHPEIVSRNDGLAAAIAHSIRGTFDPRNIQSLNVEVMPNGTIKLTGKVSSDEVKRVAGRNAETYHDDDDSRSPNSVINELEVTGRYESEESPPDKRDGPNGD